MSEIMPENTASVAENTTEPTTHEVAWCDPRGCCASAPAASERKHHANGTPIDLSLQDEIHYDREYHGLPMLEVMVQQHVRDAEPIFCLYSESAKSNSISDDTGMDLDITRGEAVQLRDELTRWIDATA